MLQKRLTGDRTVSCAMIHGATLECYFEEAIEVLTEDARMLLLAAHERQNAGDFAASEAYIVKAATVLEHLANVADEQAVKDPHVYKVRDAHRQ